MSDEKLAKTVAAVERREVENGGLSIPAFITAVGNQLARKIFEKRGNHSEVHLHEKELAAAVSLGAELVAEKMQARVRELEAALELYADPSCCDGDQHHEEKCKVGQALAGLR